MRKAALLIPLILTARLALAATGDKTSTVIGTVTRLDAKERSLFVSDASGSETRFVWTSETRINGTMSQGAKVTVRYTTSDGQNLAHQISVAK